MEAGNTLFAEGDVSDGNFYFIIGGQVQIRISDELGPLLPPKMLKLMSNGCSFGDRALSEIGAKRTAKVSAVKDCLFGTLKRHDFLRITHQFYDHAATALELAPEVRTDEQLAMIGSVLEDSEFMRGLQVRLAHVLLTFSP